MHFMFDLNTKQSEKLWKVLSLFKLKTKPWTLFIAGCNKCASASSAVSERTDSLAQKNGLRKTPQEWLHPILWLETRRWLTEKAPSHSCGRRAAPGCFVVTSVSRTAGCLLRNYSLICGGPRLQHSFAAPDPDPMIKTDQRLIISYFFFFLIYVFGVARRFIADHSALCSRLAPMTELPRCEQLGGGQ